MNKEKEEEEEKIIDDKHIGECVLGRQRSGGGSVRKEKESW